MAINTYFKNIADAIREKTGGSALITPGQMPGEVRNIVTGSAAVIKPLHADIANGWYVASSGDFYRDADPATYVNYRLDMYPIQRNHRYIVGLGTPVGGRFRVSRCNHDFFTDPDVTSPVQASNVTYNDSPTAYINFSFTSDTNIPYLYIYKSSTGGNIFSYLIDITELQNEGY